MKSSFMSSLKLDLSFFFSELGKKEQYRVEQFDILKPFFIVSFHFSFLGIRAMVGWDKITGALEDSGPVFRRLGEIYARLPSTCCLRRGNCCSLLPEMSFAEALSAVDRLIRFDPDERMRLLRRMIGYFFLNAVEITACPFLEGRNCLIYPDRFLGCRAYGLWTKAAYEKRAAANRLAKKHLQKQWQRLGVSLPRGVIDFQLPYCPDVKLETGEEASDTLLARCGESVGLLFQRFSPAYLALEQRFGRDYYFDLSFFLAALVFGAKGAVRLKFAVVRDILITGNRERLDEILAGLPAMGDKPKGM
jgi:Fe-S-cluster containining protein